MLISMFMCSLTCLTCQGSTWQACQHMLAHPSCRACSARVSVVSDAAPALEPPALEKLLPDASVPAPSLMVVLVLLMVLLGCC